MSERFMKNFNGDKVFSLEYDKETLKDMVLEKQEENGKLHSIIKEVREYIEHSQNYGIKKNIYINGDDILEILDKENK